MPEEKKHDDTRWSYSRVSCFNNCKYEYYLQYVVHDPDLYLPEGNYYAEIGSFCHEILAKIFNQELDVKDAAQYFKDNYDSNVFYETFESTMQNSYDTCLDYFKHLDLSWMQPYEVVGVEKECSFKHGSLQYFGIIDLILRDKSDGAYVILDHKSSSFPFKKDGVSVKKSCENHFESYKRQMYLYCDAVKNEYGEFPKEIIWNHFKYGGLLARIPFVQEDYEKAMKWFSRVIGAAKRERRFQPSQDFFYCKSLCNFRNSCEYAKGME